MLKELHIQSNLPLIILSVSFICIVIIGFLEFKKVSVRLNNLTEKIKTLENPNNEKDEKNRTDEKENTIEEFNEHTKDEIVMDKYTQEHQQEEHQQHQHQQQQQQQQQRR